MEVPILKGAICLDYDGPLQVLVLLIYAFKRPKKNACAPIAANCPTCKTCFTNEHLLRQTSTKLVTFIVEQPETFNPIKIENLINASYPLPFLDAKFNTLKVDSIVLTLTLLRHQSHSWVHSKSCFKKFAYKYFEILCHFVFPQSTILLKVVNVNFKIIP
jgi:hypothetical protein